MVKSTELVNRAEGLRGQSEAEAAIRKMKDPRAPEVLAGEIEHAEKDVADLLALLKARIEAARVLPPPQPNLVDGRSWAMGRDAALAAIDGV